MKKRSLILLSVCALLTCAVSLTGCDDNTGNPLDSGNISIPSMGDPDSIPPMPSMPGPGDNSTPTTSGSESNTSSSSSDKGPGGFGGDDVDF